MSIVPLSYVHPINHSQLTLNTNHDRFQATSKKSSKEAQNMTTSNWFDDQPVIGKLPAEQAAAKLREVGENEAADMLEVAQDTQSKSFFESRGRKSWWPFQDKPWQHTSHAFGYLAPSLPGSDPQPIY